MDDLNKILQSHVGTAGDSKDKLLGASFILINRDGTLFQGGAGQQTFAPDSPSYGPNTVTWIASLTKLLTSTALLQLVERGLVELDADIRTLVPALAKLQILKGFEDDGKPILEDNVKPVTLRNLLTHTVGLPYDIADPEIMRWFNYVGRENNNLSWTLEGFTTPLLFPPGEGWVYGTAMDWAGQLLEAVSGQSLSQYMEENIFKPLGLEDTTFHPAQRPDLRSRIADFAYRTPETQGSLVPGPAPIPAEFEVESGGAGLYSTAADYAKVLHATLKGDVLLKQDTTKLLLSPQLNDVQRKMMQSRVAEMPDAYTPEYPIGTPIDFTLGGMVNTEDIPEKRRKGSVMWSGYVNGHWWLDRESGLAGVLVTTVLALPPGDPVIKKLYHELEVAAYSKYAGSNKD